MSAPREDRVTPPKEEVEVLYSIRDKNGSEDWRGHLLNDRDAVREALAWEIQYPASGPYSAHRITLRIVTTETEEIVHAR